MDYFLNKKADFNKLKNFGFEQKNGTYALTKPILDGQLELTVEALPSGEVNTKIIDLGTGEPYTLHLVESAEGAFVGAVRAEYESIISEISRKCFVKDVFKTTDAAKLISYAAEKYRSELEFLWSDLPDAAILRRADSGKWYAVFMVVEGRRLGFDEDGKREIVNLHAEPFEIEKLIDGKRFIPSYHMNKKHWISSVLNGGVSFEKLCALLDESYSLAKK